MGIYQEQIQIVAELQLAFKEFKKMKEEGSNKSLMKKLDKLKNQVEEQDNKIKELQEAVVLLKRSGHEASAGSVDGDASTNGGEPESVDGDASTNEGEPGSVDGDKKAKSKSKE